MTISQVLCAAMRRLQNFTVLQLSGRKAFGPLLGGNKSSAVEGHSVPDNLLTSYMCGPTWWLPQVPPCCGCSRRLHVFLAWEDSWGPRIELLSETRHDVEATHNWRLSLLSTTAADCEKNRRIWNVHEEQQRVRYLYCCERSLDRTANNRNSMGEHHHQSAAQEWARGCYLVSSHYSPLHVEEYYSISSKLDISLAINIMRA